MLACLICVPAKPSVTCFNTDSQATMMLDVVERQQPVKARVRLCMGFFGL